MIPSPWQFVLLALAVYRLWRFCAEDDMPWLVASRTWVVGARETAGVWSFKRPTLAHMIECPFCLGFWLSFAVFFLWLAFPHASILSSIPLAISAAVGLLKKNFDA